MFSFSASLGFKSKIARLNLEGYLSKSSYEFCPDKGGLKMDLSAFYKAFGVKAGYKYAMDNYRGEISGSSSFNIGGVLSLN